MKKTPSNVQYIDHKQQNKECEGTNNVFQVVSPLCHISQFCPWS